MRIMIHACPEREWYVKEYLKPSLLKQGIREDDIIIWMDTERKGNLASCLESFRAASEFGDETWHLQDDVIVCSNFAARIAAAPKGIVCGFCVRMYEESVVCGETIGRFMWQSSFPCIKIPDKIAGEFVEWLEANMCRPGIIQYVQTGKKDDTLFRIFIQECHDKMKVTNMTPHLADHVDYLIGGSVINKTRGFVARSCMWEEENLIEELTDKMARRW